MRRKEPQYVYINSYISVIFTHFHTIKDQLMMKFAYIRLEPILELLQPYLTLIGGSN